MQDWKFFVVYHPEIFDIHEETAGTLYAANISNNLLFWYDNDNLEWHKSIYNYLDIIKDSDFEEVDENWNNGYISVFDAMNSPAPRYGLPARYPMLFPNHLMGE